MFANVIRWYTFQILIWGLRTGRNDVIEAYWDLVYLYKFGLPEIKVDLVIPWPPQPQPDPSPLYGSLVRDSLLLDMLDLAMGDPNPQPDSFIKLLGNNQIRLTAVKKLIDHYRKVIPQITAEIQRLEGLQ